MQRWDESANALSEIHRALRELNRFESALKERLEWNRFVGNGEKAAAKRTEDLYPPLLPTSHHESYSGSQRQTKTVYEKQSD